MQYDDQQQNTDPMNQGNPLDSLRKRAGDQAKDAIDNAGKRVPGGEQYADQARQAAGQGYDNLQQQGYDNLQQQQGQQGQGYDNLQQQGYDNLQQQAAGQGYDNLQQQGYDNLQQQQGQQGQQGLAGIGNMAGRQPDNPQANASNDPNRPYGNVDDVIADYGNRAPDPSQQNPTSL